MRGLTAWTAGLAGERDPAQPLLTLYDGPARVELSGATTANWVAKSANLLVDGLGGPRRVGLLLPLHWQSVALLLATVATGATAVVVSDARSLAGCDVALVDAGSAGAALDAGVDEVLALSGHPLGAPVDRLAPGAGDFAREVPSYGDHWGGPARTGWHIDVGGLPLPPLPGLGLGAGDRVLLTGSLADPADLAGLLAVLSAGASLVLAPDPDRLTLPATAAAERVTACWGIPLPAVRQLRQA